MAFSTTFWRRVSYLLALVLVVTAWNLAVPAQAQEFRPPPMDDPLVRQLVCATSLGGQIC